MPSEEHIIAIPANPDDPGGSGRQHGGAGVAGGGLSVVSTQSYLVVEPGVNRRALVDQ